MKKLKPNHIPAPGWKGGFLKKHPEMNYPNPDLDNLKFNKNLNCIDNITRQQRVLWPEFTWETRKGEKDPKRCFQMFAPDISRIGYDDTGQSWSIICPQQGTFLPGIGTFNVEVTVTGQKGWVDESNKSLAADLSVKPKIWFSPSANESAIGKLLWSVFELNNLGYKFPSEKDKAIELNTFQTDKEKTRVIALRDGLFMDGNLPDFTKHENVAWSHANVEVEIGDIDVAEHPMVAEFNNLVMKAFNLGSGNMLQKGNILAWNVWFDAPSIVDQNEWRHHADVWRRSIDVDHCSPDGPGTLPRYADGTPFSAEQDIVDDIIKEIIKFVKKHL
ncbi:MULTISPECIES: hypothetical protein [Winogradskyella]|uniref:hypothetical protein n=1 Tax=Winogradskyella TaxID=286104 RepID=UPI001B051B53|nr:hypothetical protein [Winogradskyella sp.]MBO6881822.1 hypothetical protein [Winogradskyella sp.]